ncbi:MAG: hypothetical protein MPN21_26935 [Thermoanaerobaculia bacterium]|nr:hypothetical protein [Thermoanaerobaculia bacterium]
MSRLNAKPVPVNLIAGPLGVGKTTTINHLLQLRPPSERWAVLVNEYGLVGLDAALMRGGGESDQPAGVEILEVAGGCICCSARVMFEASLVRLLRRRPDRLLIEPTGLATASGILDMLGRPGIREAVDVRSVVCLLDPGRLDEVTARDEIRDQADAADIVLASRSDLASMAEIHAFQAWAHGLFPSKRHVGLLEYGKMSPSLLDFVSRRRDVATPKGHRLRIYRHREAHARDVVAGDPGAQLLCDEAHPVRQHLHRSRLASTIGWVCWEGLVFDAERAVSWLRELAKLPGARRTKAVLRTTKGWWGFNWADGAEEAKPSGYRGNSRLEVVIEGVQLPDPEALEHDLRACLSPASAQSAAAI